MTKRRILVGLGLVVALPLAALLLALLVGQVVFTSKLSTPWEVEVQQMPLPTNPEALARGEHLVEALANCGDCHGEDLGGRVMFDGGGLLAVIAGPNITPTGAVADYSDEDWFRALRHGLRPDGTPLLFMPSHEFAAYSLEDTAAIIAWLRSVAPVERKPAPTTAGVVMKAVYLTGMMPEIIPAEVIDHDADPPPHLDPEPTVRYGERLAGACKGCHGNGLSGGSMPGAPPEIPPAANITPHADGLGDWTQAQFVTAMRTGKRPDGSDIDPFMPWRVYRNLDDVELQALWKYLRTVEPREAGNR